ncbi:HAD family hydrolase [Streptomyces caniscabiei]|uniref:HAD family hydrolase n=1 Tax=Streptomyces caniscabiei TaxID=2746961 RepID=UPI0007658598|nr:HAD family hydrolase [Streptomyces caniscabiei]
MPYAAVIFDFYGTLTPSIPAEVWVEQTARSAPPLGIPAPIWCQAFDESFPERIVGALGGVEDTLRILARRCGVEPDPVALSAACAARRSAQSELYALRPDTLPTLRTLRGLGLPIGVLSDCSVELAEFWGSLPLAGLVDGVVLSCEAGLRKPDPELFRLAASSLGVESEDCLYIGDGGSHELSGAAACGMTAVMLRAADWADNDVVMRENDWAGLWIPSLSLVPSLLNAPK